MALAECEVDFGLLEIAGIAGNAQRSRMIARRCGHDLHQPARPGRADGLGAEHGFLQRMGIDQRRIDLPIVRRGPLRRGEARCRLGAAADRRVIGHPELG